MRVSFCLGGFRGLRGFIDLLYFWRFPGFDLFGILVGGLQGLIVLKYCWRSLGFDRFIFIGY